MADERKDRVEAFFDGIFAAATAYVYCSYSNKSDAEQEQLIQSRLHEVGREIGKMAEEKMLGDEMLRDERLE